MNSLELMALENAIKCIRRTKEKNSEVHQWRETPLSDSQRIEIRVEMDRLLDNAMDWIKAVIESEEDKS